MRRIFLYMLFGLLVLGIPVGHILSQTTPPAAPETDPGDGTLRRIRVPILMYHYVSNLPADADATRVQLTVDPAMFRAHLAYLSQNGYSTISLYQLDDALMRGVPLPPRPVVLTFDDGYIDHYVNVFPALKEYGFTATFFIITGRPHTNDRAYMTWDEIHEMADAGMSMESHTKTHQELQDRDYDFLVYELLGSLQSLQAHTGHEPHMFAYPVGHYDDETLRVLAQLPVWRALTTERGALHTSDNRLEVPRVRINGDMGVSALASLLQTS
ncbi:MAG TPA: polysaccharide deacetylase family protein [Terriglobales bacterium]|nr:polysaccharide deacetylase family protein [Terriglobales bacterium]